MSELGIKLKKEFKDKEYAHVYVDEFLNASIATQIKVLREQRGWTQKHLASLTGMKQSRISLLENINYSQWSISTLKKIAEAFDLTLNVSFESFSMRIRDIENFNRKSLERLSRMDDLSSAFKGQAKLQGLASASQLSLNLGNFTDSGSQNILNIPRKPSTALDRPVFSELNKAA
jgi:Predicted transcriptional regulators